MKHIVTALCLVSLASCSYPRYWIDRTERFEFEPATATSLRCETHNGSIQSTVDAARQKVVVVAAIKAGGADAEDARRAMEALRVNCAVTGGELAMDWSWRTEDDDWGAEVSFDVQLQTALPTKATTHNGEIDVVASRECAAESHNGSVTVAGDASKVSAQSHNGSIRVTGPLRQLEVSTHNGGVRLDGTVSGPIDGHVITHNGQIDVTVPEGSSTSLHCSTSNGSIRSTAQLQDQRRGDGYLSGRLGDGGGDLELRSHNGSISLRSGAPGQPR